jgi:hypothetical protein
MVLVCECGLAKTVAVCSNNSKSVVWSCDAAQNDGQDYGNEGTFSTRAV